jgi:hypothetical protein
LLEEAISGGFDGSGEFDLLLTEAFGTDEDWPELVEAMRANVPAPSIEILDWPTPGPSRAIRDAELWWRYFAYASPTGATWSETAFVPIFQTDAVLGAEVLLRNRAEAYPDLAELTIGITSVDGGPAIRPQTEHPYAAGFQVALNGAAPVPVARDGAWPLPLEPAGVHEARIATVTAYGALGPETVAYRVR